jgi:hypothetical protein
MKNKNINRDAKNLYLSGVSQAEICEKLDMKKWDLAKLINNLISTYPMELKEDRIIQAGLMEANIFELIRKGKDVKGLVKQFSSFCA